MRSNHELLDDCIPTREEKRKIARVLRYSNEVPIYKWCSGERRSPMDVVDEILDHARLYHPTAAIAVVDHFNQDNARTVGGFVGTNLQLVTSIQASTEQKALDVVAALSAAMRDLLATGTADLKAVLHGVEECQQQTHLAATMLRARLQQDTAHAGRGA